jgi:hypothetical protein
MKITQSNQGCSNSQGFTRTDLVACIAVVVVLTALAASALSGSRDNTSRMVCGNNMRQMALAEGMYAGDYRDYLAFCNWDSGNFIQAPNGEDVVGWLYTCSGSIPQPTSVHYKSNPIICWSGGPNGAPGGGSWWPYVQNMNSYLCPVDLQNPNYTHRANQLCSYVMNGAACGFSLEADGEYRTCKISDVWSPACVLLWEPNSTSLGGVVEFNDGANFPSTPVSTPPGTEGLGALHCNNGGEVVTVGGNVTFMTSNQFNCESETPVGVQKTLLWWSPFTADGR